MSSQRKEQKFFDVNPNLFLYILYLLLLENCPTEHKWLVFFPQQTKIHSPNIYVAMDAMGRTAIEIAVDNENIEIVELLLQQVRTKINFDSQPKI